MIRILKTFTVLLLMSKSVFSQETYPRTLLIDKDTLVVLRPKQVRNINISYEHKRFLEAENSIIKNTLSQYIELGTKKDSIINEKTKTEADLKLDVANIKSQYNDLREENNKLNINLTKAKKSRKIWLMSGIGIGIITTLLIQ